MDKHKVTYANYHPTHISATGGLGNDSVDEWCKVTGKIKCNELTARIETDDIITVLQQYSLQLYEHISRKSKNE